MGVDVTSEFLKDKRSSRKDEGTRPAFLVLPPKNLSQLSNSRQLNLLSRPIVFNNPKTAGSTIRRSSMAAIAPPLAIIIALVVVFYLAKWSVYRHK